jgi:hypothetical protein
MKSMHQLQSELLSKARWDGGYPKAVHMGMGTIALANSAEEEREMRRGTVIAHLVGIPLGLVLGLALACLPWLLS